MRKRSPARRPSPSRKIRSPKSLIRTLTDSAALPTFVRSLSTPVLHKLIDHVGVRDAGELIALTTTEQLRGVFEVALWDSITAGGAEILRAEKFVEWLDVMLEVGGTFAAQRLIELGESFVVVNFAPLLRTLDREVGVEHLEEPPCFCLYCELAARDVPFEIFEDYVVTPVHEDEWDVVKAALLEIDAEDREFLGRVLARCSPRPTARAFADDSWPVLDDETHEREQRRERRGFVTPPLAARFLADARRAPLAELVACNDYDDITQRYFEQIAAAAADATEARRRATEESLADGPGVSAAELRELEVALMEAEIIAERAPLLLSGPRADRAELELKKRLDALRSSHPEAFATRLGELAYLANVLMAGCSPGQRFTESDAAHGALACANLGLEHVLDRRDLAADDRADAANERLRRAPGIVGLFAIGWNLLQAVPLRCATALLEALRSEEVRARLARKRWMLAEVEAALSKPDMREAIERGAFDEVGDNLMLLSLVLDARACQCLRTLIAEVPRYPVQLELGFARSERVVGEHRFLAREEELARVDVFLSGLRALVKA